MKTTHSFCIDFIIRRNKENRKRALVYARITVDGDRKEISLKEQIDADDWDSKSETVKGKGIKAKTVNSAIEEARYGIKEKYRKLQSESSLITAETVKQAYLGVHAAQKGHTLCELLDYYKKIWEGKLKNGGFKNYKTTIEYIKLFVAHQSTTGDMFISQLTVQTITEFEHYIRTTPIKQHDPCLGNGIGKHIQRFKRIMNWAVELEWLKVNPFEKYSCPLKRSKRKKLSIQELVVLERKQFLDANLEYARDIFIYSCFTGLAFIDAMTLKEEDFEFDTNGTVWCRKYRTKSDELSMVPLLKSAATILNRYRSEATNKNRDTIFRVVSNQYMNRCLKVIKEACEITTPMTFHVARHTFAKTVALKNGVPLETVQMMMGHTKISTTQIYADVDEEKIIGDMSGLEDKLNVKRQTIAMNNQLKAV